MLVYQGEWAAKGWIARCSQAESGKPSMNDNLTLKSILERPPLASALAWAYLREVGWRPHDLPDKTSLETLVRAGVLCSDHYTIGETFGLHRAYACLEWYRQVLIPDQFAQRLQAVPIAGKRILARISHQPIESGRICVW